MTNQPGQTEQPNQGERVVRLLEARIGADARTIAVLQDELQQAHAENAALVGRLTNGGDRG